jgi:hypothetical protein
VIGALEDAEDYKAFEAAIIADYDAQSAVERELVLRLASLLWRLRRAKHRTAAHAKLNTCPAPSANPPKPPSILPLSSRVVFCALPICLTRRSTGSTDMKRPFGVRPARFCSHLMSWIAANHGIGGAVSVSAVGKNCRSTIPRNVSSCPPARLPDSSKQIYKTSTLAAAPLWAGCSCERWTRELPA